jgi:hypothetical protein
MYSQTQASDRGDHIIDWEWLFIYCAMVAALCLGSITASILLGPTAEPLSSSALTPQGGPGKPKPRNKPKATTPQMVALLRDAIISQESGGDHTLMNASGSGATGLGQVMPENIGPWSREFLGRELTQQQFIDSPQLQLAIIDGKLSQYWRAAMRHTNGRVNESVRRSASAWYSGDPELFDNTNPQSWNGNPYPSISAYTTDVLHKFMRRKQKAGL